MEGWMDGRMDGRMDGWIEREPDGWIGQRRRRNRQMSGE